MTKDNGSVTTGISLPSELFERLEISREDVSRSRYVQRALEAYLPEETATA